MNISLCAFAPLREKFLSAVAVMIAAAMICNAAGEVAGSWDLRSTTEVC